MNAKIVTTIIVAALMAVAFPMISATDDNDAALGTATGQYKTRWMMPQRLQ